MVTPNAITIYVSQDALNDGNVKGSKDRLQAI